MGPSRERLGGHEMIKTIKTIEQVSIKAADSAIYTQHAVAKAFKLYGNADSITTLEVGRTWWKVTKSMCADVCKACNWYIQGCDNDLSNGELDSEQVAYVERRKAQWMRVREIAYAQYKTF